MNMSFIVGEFQPFHTGHLRLLTEAVENSDHSIVFIDKSNCLNTFSFYKVVDMITWSTTKELQSKFTIIPLPEFANECETIDFISKSITGYASTISKNFNVEYYTGSTEYDKYQSLSQKYPTKLVQHNGVDTNNVVDLLFGSRLHPRSMSEIPHGTKEILSEFYNE